MSKRCKLCGCIRTEGSHRENPRWQGDAGKGKTFHNFTPVERKKKRAGSTARALADEWKNGRADR